MRTWQTPHSLVRTQRAFGPAIFHPWGHHQGTGAGLSLLVTTTSGHGCRIEIQNPDRKRTRGIGKTLRDGAGASILRMKSITSIGM